MKTMMKTCAFFFLLICGRIEAGDIISLPDDIKSIILSQLKPSELISLGLSSKEAHKFIRQHHQWQAIAINLYLNNQKEFKELIGNHKNNYRLSDLFFKTKDDSWYQVSLILVNLKNYKKDRNLCDKYNLFSTEKAFDDLSSLARVPYYFTHLPALCLSMSAIFCGYINLINPIVIFNPILLPLDIGILCSGGGVLIAIALSLTLFEAGVEVLDKKMTAYDQARILQSITVKNPRWLKKIEQCLEIHN